MSAHIQIKLEGGAEAGDVYWRVSSSATFGVGSKVVGTVMAYASIHLNAGAEVEGRLFALNEQVTMIGNTIIVPDAPTTETYVDLKYCDILNSGTHIPTSMFCSAPTPARPQWCP